MKNCIEVCAAVVRKDGRILLATRRPGAHLAGKWEFPGGKIKGGESAFGCIERELREELNLEVTAKSELFRLEHEYPEKLVGLHFILCESVGEPTPMEGQQCSWFELGDAVKLDLADADRKALELLEHDFSKESGN